MEITADLAGGRQQFVFLGVKAVMPLQQNVGNLPSRNIDATLTEFLEQAVLCDMILVDLQKDVLPQTEPEVRTDILWPPGDAQRSIRQPIDRSPVEENFGLNDEVLDIEISIALDSRSVWQVFERQRNGVSNLEVWFIAAFGGTGPFFTRLSLGLVGLEQLAGCDLGASRGTFELLNSSLSSRISRYWRAMTSTSASTKGVWSATGNSIPAIRIGFGPLESVLLIRYRERQTDSPSKGQFQRVIEQLPSDVPAC